MNRQIGRVSALGSLVLFSLATAANAQVTSGGHVALQGTYVEVGVNHNGYFGMPASVVPAGYHPHCATCMPGGLGFVADYRKNGWTGQYGGDYFTPGNPYEGFSVKWTSAATHLYGNYGGGSSTIPTLSLTDNSSGNTLSAVWTGQVASGSDQVMVVQTYSFQTGALYFTANVQIINTGTTTLNSVQYLRSVDPDNDETWGGTYNTVNQLVSQNPNASNQALATATGTHVTDMLLGLGAIDARAVVGRGYGLGTTDPATVVAASGAGPVTEDKAIGVVFNIGTLAPGQSASLNFAYILSAADLGNALGTLAAVTIQQPTGTISGTSVPFQVTTNNLPQTTQVDFYVNGTLIGSSTTQTGSSYTTSFDSTLYPNGNLSLKAVATINGNPVTATSTVVVNNSGPPMSFITPTNAATVSGDGIPVQLSTSATNPPASVTMYREVSGKPTVTLGTFTTAPFQTTFNTSDLAGGTAITIRAIGTSGGGQSTNITVGVVTSAGVSTTTAVTSSLNPSTDADPVQFTATVTPSSATGSVQFKVDSTNIGSPVTLSGGTAVSSPYTITSPGAHTIAAIFTGSGTSLSSSGTMTQNVNVGPPATLTVAAASQNQTATVGAVSYPNPLTVTVLDAAGNPIPSAAVSFMVPMFGASAGLDASVQNTDASGHATVNATPNTIAGSFQIDVSCGTATTTLSLTNAPGAPASLTLGAGVNGQSGVVGGPAFANPLLAILMDAYGNAVPGVTLMFIAPPSGASAFLTAGAATTDINGQASVLGKPNFIAGSYSVWVQTGILKLPISLTNAAGPAVLLTVDAASTPQAAVVGGNAFGAPLGVTASDAFNNPVPGATINFIAPGNGATALLSATSAQTDSTGHTQIIASTGNQAGAYAVVAANATAPSASFALTNQAGPAAALQLVSGGGQHAAVATAFANPIIASLTDAYGNAVSGVQVAFAAPATGASATLSANSVASDGNGLVNVLATAGTVAGAYSLDATAPGVAAPLAIALNNDPGAPANLMADALSTPQTSGVSQPFATALGATLTDTYGNAIPNAALTFSAPPAGASALLSASTAATDSNGHGQVLAVAGTVTGAYSVTVSATAAVSTLFALTNSAGAPGTIAVASGSGQDASVDGAFANPLVALVTDAYANPVPGAMVSFAAPASGASAMLSQASVLTDANGLATLSATPNTVAGAYQVIASVSGAASPAAFQLVNDPGLPNAITAAPLAAAQSAQVSTAFALPLGVMVTDSHGNPIPGTTVSYAGPASGAAAVLSAATAATDSTGAANVTAAANTQTGTYEVDASVNGVAAPARFALNNLPGAPGTLSVIGGNAQTAAVAMAFGAPLKAHLSDSFGNAVPNAVISFSVPSSGASANLASLSATTGPDGNASVAATASQVAGTYQVTANTFGVATPAQWALTNAPGGPAALLVGAGSDGQSARVGDAYASPLSATVVDAYGNTVPGVAVTFGCPATAATCSLDTSHVTSDGNGRVAVHATAGSVPGAVQVEAWFSGGTPVMINLTNLVGLPGSIAVTSGAIQSAGVFQPYAHPLQVIVKDRFGNAVPSAPVSFLVVSSGAQSVILSALSATTDGNGAAGVTGTANASKGALSVRASAPGVATPAVFNLINTSVATAVSMKLELPVYDTVLASKGATRVQISVGPSAGGSPPSGSIQLIATGPIQMLPGQDGVSPSGGGWICPLKNGSATFDIQVQGWQSRMLRASYVPDSAAAGTFDSSESAISVSAPDLQANDAGGCSAGGAAQLSPLVGLAFAMLALRRRAARQGSRR